MNPLDDTSYSRFCGPQNLHKALNTLRGIMTGIAIDGVITPEEANELKAWSRENECYGKYNPFSEIIPLIEAAVVAAQPDVEEIKDLQWYLRRVSEDRTFYNGCTADLQYLQGILHGVLADGEVTREEIDQLSKWMEENDQLAGCYPYDEIYGIVLEILRDGVLSADEAKLAKEFFAEFVQISDGAKGAWTVAGKRQVTALGVCSVDPEITFAGKVFCFTGKSERAKRSEFAEIVTGRGGRFTNSVVKELDYLIYGAGGNQCWAYSCYGRKVEQVVAMRKAGRQALIVHELDFWDSCNG